MKNLIRSQLVRLSPYNIQFAWAFDPEKHLWRTRDVVRTHRRA